MSYGGIITNADGIVLLDNLPFHGFEVIAKGIVANGTAMSSLYSGTGISTFIRPLSGGGIYTDITLNIITANGSNIEYVQIASAAASPVSGFGLVLYDNTASPGLVFSSNMPFVKLRLSVMYNPGTATFPVIATATGMNKYISLNAMGYTNLLDTGAINSYVYLSSTSITITSSYTSWYYFGGGGITITNQYNVIEC
jgi:hypothetical protein